MKKRRRNKKRNFLIFVGILVIYIGAMAYTMLTVSKPAELIVEPETADMVMNGVSKTPIKVTVLSNTGEPMSGQSISFKLIKGSGKVTTILGVTSEEGTALGEYQTGYGDQEQTAEVFIENITGLTKTVYIKEYPSTIIPDHILIEADTEKPDMLENGLEIYATIFDSNGNPIPNHKLLFKVESGSVGFFGFKMMAGVTDANGVAMQRYQPSASGDVVISVGSEEESSVSTEISFKVR